MKNTPSLVRAAGLFAAAVSAAALAGCADTGRESADASTTRPAAMSSSEPVQISPYGTTADGQKVSRYALTNAKGHSVEVIDFGGIVTAVNVPDKDGKLANVALHFDDLAGYEKPGPYFGATIGRYGNRIAGGKFDLNGQTYALATNNGPNSLHGGEKGFDKRLWEAQPVGDQKAAVRLHRLSPDGEEGYPSSLDVAVTITLTDDDHLHFDYEAKNTGGKDTVLNLTNHTYWNLNGAGNGTILDERLTLDCDKYLPVNDVQIPTGEEKAVKGTPFDFTTPHTIGERIADTGGGYDHNFIVNGKPGKLRDAAKVVDPRSGRVMSVRTTEPGVQLYTSNFLDATGAGNGYKKNAALCLETQHFPDAPNQPKFPSTTLRAGDTYKSTTVYEFSTQK